MADCCFTDNPAKVLDETVETLNPDRVLVVTDFNVERMVLPSLSDSQILNEAPSIAIPGGEIGKNLESVSEIWKKLEEIGATRRSLIINIGGGVVTDLGGFAAGTFKRGIRTINFPTTLLGAVDAATGGKTGINFIGLKNEIGVFHLPSKVIVSVLPFATLHEKEILSGYAEMIKTAIINDRDFYISLSDLEQVVEDNTQLESAVKKCVLIKEEIVAEDPKESGVRKILNFGHTTGHAFESFCIEKGEEITHGKAVAHGMLVALILSHMLLGFDSGELYHYLQFLKKYYGGPLIKCEEKEIVIHKMNNDKKNQVYGEPRFTLLRDIGNPEINCCPSQSQIKEALEIYNDMME